MSEPVLLVLQGWAATSVLMVLLWVRQTATRNATSVDAVWALCLGLLAAAYAWRTDGNVARRALVAALAGAWSLRLFYYLFRNRVLGERGAEDGRYRAMREHWGEQAQSRFFFIYLLQAAIATLFSVFFLLAMRRPGPGLDVWDGLGIGLAAIALVGESIADRQLGRWRRNPDNRGKTCRVGLWGWSRHPNYFFEWLHWFAYVLIAWGAPWWWATLLGPALMLLFLFRVTGIPWTEAQALKSRSEDYRRYQRETSVFFPLPPRSEQS